MISLYDIPRLGSLGDLWSTGESTRELRLRFDQVRPETLSQRSQKSRISSPHSWPHLRTLCIANCPMSLTTFLNFAHDRETPNLSLHSFIANQCNLIGPSLLRLGSGLTALEITDCSDAPAVKSFLDSYTGFLETLTLRLNGDEVVPDTSFTQLAKSVCRQSKLKKLSLNFWEQICSSETIYQFGSSLPELLDLGIRLNCVTRWPEACVSLTFSVIRLKLTVPLYQLEDTVYGAMMNLTHLHIIHPPNAESQRRRLQKALSLVSQVKSRPKMEQVTIGDERYRVGYEFGNGECFIKLEETWSGFHPDLKVRQIE